MSDETRSKTIGRNNGMFKHGHATGYLHSSEYNAWRAAKKRVTNKTSLDYKDYGARGIKMCAKWLDSFAAFYSDMGPKPSKAHSLGRIDNDGDYCPENCRWETQIQQQSNTTRNHFVTYKGITNTCSGWARILNAGPSTIRGWLKKYGGFPERVLPLANKLLKGLK